MKNYPKQDRQNYASRKETLSADEISISRKFDKDILMVIENMAMVAIIMTQSFLLKSLEIL